MYTYIVLLVVTTPGCNRSLSVVQSVALRVLCFVHVRLNGVFTQSRVFRKQRSVHLSVRNSLKPHTAVASLVRAEQRWCFEMFLNYMCVYNIHGVVTVFLISFSVLLLFACQSIAQVGVCFLKSYHGVNTLLVVFVRNLF